MLITEFENKSYMLEFAKNLIIVFFGPFDIFPRAPMTTDNTVVLSFHILPISMRRSLYLLRFSSVYKDIGYVACDCNDDKKTKLSNFIHICLVDLTGFPYRRLNLRRA